MLTMLKDPEDITLIGPVIKEQQKIINDTIEKKLSLSKLQSTIWEKSMSSNKDSDFSLSDVDDTLLQSLIQKDVNKDSNNDNSYKI